MASGFLRIAEEVFSRGNHAITFKDMIFMFTFYHVLLTFILLAVWISVTNRRKETSAVSALKISIESHLKRPASGKSIGSINLAKLDKIQDIKFYKKVRKPDHRASNSLSLNRPLSKLLSIPYDIRIVMLEHLLVIETPIQNPNNPKERTWRETKAFRSSSRVHTSILRTCKQLAEESRRILYGKNLFEFNSLYSLERFMKRGVFLSCLYFSPSLRAISSLSLAVRPFSSTRVYFSPDEKTFEMDRMLDKGGQFCTVWEADFIFNLLSLTLDFRCWLLSADDEIPTRLTEIIKISAQKQQIEDAKFPRRLYNVTLMGLENLPAYRKELEDAFRASKPSNSSVTN